VGFNVGSRREVPGERRPVIINGGGGDDNDDDDDKLYSF
jgi:hypothetical protein